MAITPVENFVPGPVIVGAGPVGMLTALRLAQLGVPSTLCEMSTETTRWPKMDNNNPHTMEIFRSMGLVDEYRSQLGAISQTEDWDTVFFNTCGPNGKIVSTWNLPSTESYRAEINSENDGSHPAEPGQRCSQIVLETLLKRKCLVEKLITCHFGYKFDSLEEDYTGVTATFIDLENEMKIIRAAYLVGADGGQSRVRKCVGIKLEGKPLPLSFFMVHFRSKALRKLSPLGNWWHAFNMEGGFIIDQDGNDTYTCHHPCGNDTELIRKFQEHPEQVPQLVLGGLGHPYVFDIDEILVANAWRPNFALANSYVSCEGRGRVFLAGDAAHRNPPHGGYGMNSGVEDAMSLAWRLSALHKGFGGSKLITSYTNERRPNMMMRLQRCDDHIGKFTPMVISTNKAPNKGIFLEDSPEGDEARSAIAKQLDSVGSENIDRGVELDLRYLNSEVIVTDGTKEPAFNILKYTPSTRPGHRAPHVLLKGSNQSILDLYGPEWTLVDFSRVQSKNQETSDSTRKEKEAAVTAFKTVARYINMSLRHIPVDSSEEQAKMIWENYDLVLVRPDGYVAWRGGKKGARDDSFELQNGRIGDILRTVLGWNVDIGFVEGQNRELDFESDFSSFRDLAQSEV